MAQYGLGEFFEDFFLIFSHFPPMRLPFNVLTLWHVLFYFCPSSIFVVRSSSLYAGGGSLSSTNTSIGVWCECRKKAESTFNLDSLRYSYFFTGLFFGLWALISLWTCVAVVRERGVRQLGHDRDAAIYIEGFALGSSSSA